MTTVALGLFALFVWMAHHATRELRSARTLPLPDDAISIAARRLRTGQISAEEFDRIARILRA